jgi:hypothetical protein
MEGAGTDLDQPVHVRRTLYSRISRDEQSDMLRLYDFPPPTTHSPSRDITTTPLQQLFVLNSGFVEQQASSLAQRLLQQPNVSTKDRIEQSYQRLFQRAPRSEELQLAERFLTLNADKVPEADRWRRYLQSLFGLNEFLFVD